jgi:UDP-N-acetylmuramoylalanine--D-glutamate ligase
VLLSWKWDVTGVDAKEVSLDSLKASGLKVRAPSQLSAADFDLVVVSPGVPQTDALYQEALEKGIEVVGEAELALRSCRQKCVAITGTNGKTTVTLLVHHVLKSCGIKARALGNIGEPLSKYFLNRDEDEVLVIELSSYQLETMKTPAFDAAVILNITPDHLDRYASMEAYAAAKWRLADCLKKGAPLYVHEQVLQTASPRQEVKSYGCSERAELSTDRLVVREGERVEYILPLRYRQAGVHESENALAGWALCKVLGVSPDAFCKALETFSKPPHRIEFVKEINGVFYFDDSKGTNIDAVIRAVEAMPSSVILIAGGVDKGASYLLWKERLQEKVRCIIAIGQAAPKIERELAVFYDIRRADSLEEAVKEASSIALPGECVLLSPGCASYDMFRDYAHRGEEFKRYINTLEERRITT